MKNIKSGRFDDRLGLGIRCTIGGGGGGEFFDQLSSSSCHLVNNFAKFNGLTMGLHVFIYVFEMESAEDNSTDLFILSSQFEMLFTDL